MLFLSTFINKIDKKSRLSIPASYRAILATHSEDHGTLLALKSPQHAAIECMTSTRLEDLSKSIDNLGVYSSAYDDLTAIFFAGTTALPFDAEGRVTLPQELLSFANIEDTAAVVGRGHSFQIWNPRVFETHQAAARDRLTKNPQMLMLNLGGNSHGK